MGRKKGVKGATPRAAEEDEPNKSPMWGLHYQNGKEYNFLPSNLETPSYVTEGLGQSLGLSPGLGPVDQVTSFPYHLWEEVSSIICTNDHNSPGNSPAVLEGCNQINIHEDVLISDEVEDKDNDQEEEWITQELPDALYNIEQGQLPSTDILDESNSQSQPSISRLKKCFKHAQKGQKLIRGPKGHILLPSFSGVKPKHQKLLENTGKCMISETPPVRVTGKSRRRGGMGKKKKYEQDPSINEKEEEKRIAAIKAKQYRDEKNKKNQGMKEELERLVDENIELQAKYDGLSSGSTIKELMEQNMILKEESGRWKEKYTLLEEVVTLRRNENDYLKKEVHELRAQLYSRQPPANQLVMRPHSH